jgi:cytochrome c peroxidase
MILPVLLIALQAAGARGAVDPLGRGSWLIDEENDEVLLVEPMQVLEHVKVGRWPEQLAVDARGRVFVTCREAGTLDVIDKDLHVRSIAIGPEPRALALDEPHGRVFVGTVTGHELVSLRLDTLEVLARRRVEWPVRALAVTASGLAAISERVPALTLFDRELLGPATVLPLDAAKQALQPQWLVEDGDALFVVSRHVATGLDEPMSGGGYGGGIDSPHQLFVHALRGFSAGLPATFAEMHVRGLPDASSVLMRQGQLIIASRSASTLVVVASDTLGLIAEPGLSDKPSRREVFDVEHSGVSAAALSSRGDVLLLQPDDRQLRWLRVSTAGPRVSRGRSSSFVELVEVSAASRLPSSQLDRELRLGRALFHDARNMRVSNRLMSCASCHLDGREDGLVWEQNGTMRQTPMLAGGRLAETAPYNWLGTARTLEANIQKTVKERLQGDGLNKKELRALARYVREGLRPVQRPAAAEPALVAEGKLVFERSDVGCASCHPADFAFTDGQEHNIHSVGRAERGTFAEAHMFDESGPPKRMPIMVPEKPRGMLLTLLNGLEPDLQPQAPPQEPPPPQQQAREPPSTHDEPVKAARIPVRFNTPSLAFLSQTPPYLHDGSAPTLEALLRDNHDRMGTTSQLSEKEQRALVAYLESL